MMHFSSALVFLSMTVYSGGPAAAFTTTPHLHSRSLHTGLVNSQRSLPAQSNNIFAANIILTATGDQTQQKISATRLHLFGFGNAVEEDQTDLAEGELARFSHLVPSDANPKVKFDSLSIMMSEWSKLFTEEDRDMGLTTPVEVRALNPQANPPGNDADDDVSAYAGTQLVFVKGKTGGYTAYKDKDDQNNKDQKEEEVKQGGVEVRVEQLTNGDLQVVATRCEIEEGTMVKEMSETIIIDSLRKAMAAWKKEQGA